VTDAPEVSLAGIGREAGTVAGIGRELEDVLIVLGDARRLVGAGVLVDLGGLDGRIEHACQALAGLSPAEASAHLPGLVEVAEGLAALEAECRSRREALGLPAEAPPGGPAPALAAHHRAARAYARPRDDET
jgi:hypothetical protein